ncbi:VOC family protein [Leifsonia sp. L25]|uniref:VOC family protein n=1 Tax=Actinomycetes TaxID=1760 RepID=UPI003D693D7C
MPIVTDFPPGTPVWVDLQTSDPAAASSFYRSLFGWDVTEADPASGGYAIASLGGTPAAAIGPFPPGMERPVWTVYFAVADIDASAAAATEAGGAVLLPPGEVMPGIRLAVVADPAGAVLGLWQRDQDSPWLRDEPGAVDWLELAAPDYEQTFPFYEAVLGVAVSEMRVNDEPYGLLDVGPANVAGATTAARGVPAHWLVYFGVADLDAAVLRLTELGGSVLEAPVAAAGVGRWAIVTDALGAGFGLLEPEAR